MSEMPEMPFICPLCMTWQCDLCQYRIYYQNPHYTGTRRCGDCGSSIGTMYKVRHSSYSIAEDHWEQYEFEKMAENDRKLFNQGATTIARLEREEDTMQKSPARYHTPQDFEQAEWAKHPEGMFAHRRGDIGPDGFPWLLINEFDVAENYSDEGMAERDDFVIVETGTVLTARQLGRLANRYEGETLLDVEELLTEAGVKIVEDKHLPIPQDFGVRFLAKKNDDPTEWEFVTIRNGDEMNILCTDSGENNGICLPPSVFIARGFYVTELL